MSATRQRPGGAESAAPGAARAAPPRAAARRPAFERLPLLLLGFVALLAGIGGGLARLAWPMPQAVAQRLLDDHARARGLASAAGLVPDAALVEIDPLETVMPQALTPAWYEERMRANLDALAAIAITSASLASDFRC